MNLSTSNQQPATSNQQPATSNQRPATSNQQPATSNQQPATSDQQPATSNQQPATSNQQPGTSNQQPATTNQRPATSNQQPPTTNQQPATSNQQPATSNQQPATSGQQPATSNQRPATTHQQPMRQFRSLFVLACLISSNLHAQDSPGRSVSAAGLSAATHAPGTPIAIAEFNAWPGQTNLPLPTPASNVVAAYVLQGRYRQPLSWVFNQDATQLHLELPAHGPSHSPAPARLYLESAERTTQFADGRIVFSALDAVVHGNRAKLESHPGNHRIGFWTDPSDSVSWTYKPTRWGKYDVELAYSAAGGDGTELEIEVAGQKLSVARPSTGTWYRYSTVPVGRVYVAKAEPFTVRASCKTLRGAAALNLKAVILRPAPEGKPLVQDPSGAVTLAAADAITHSTVMRFEPAT